MATTTVRGTGTAYGTPDEATLGLRVESVRGTAAGALADVAERTKVLVTLCHEVGLADGDVTTTGVSVAEQGEHDGDGRWQRRGDRASNRVSARVPDVARPGPPEPRPMMRMAVAAAETVPIEAGELSVLAIVDVELDVEQG